MTRNCITVMAILLAAGTAPAASSARRDMGQITTADLDLAPNEMLLLPAGREALSSFGEETLRYYIGDPNKKAGASGGVLFTAARFTPAFPCTLKAIYFGQMEASMDDYAFAFGQGYETIPGPVLDSGPYSGSGEQMFKRVDLAGQLVFLPGTDFWTCVRFTHETGKFPATMDAGPMVMDRGGFISTGGKWAQIKNLGQDANWIQGAIVTRGTQPAHDVGVVRITAPGPQAGPGSCHPEVQLANFGLNAETDVPLTCSIDSAGTEVYRDDAVFAGPLPSNGRATVTFSRAWQTISAENSYTVTIFSSLAEDLDRTNDTLSQTTTIMPRRTVATLDTGYCALSVTSFGAIGYDAPEDAGVGFQYPKGAASGLRYAALAVGNYDTYLVDRFYACPPGGAPDADFQTYDSLSSIFPPNGDQQFKGSYTDAGLPRPKELQVVQNSHQSSETDRDDFVVMAFDIRNHGLSPQNALYAGVFADFDIGATPEQNAVGTDLTRRLVYAKPGTGENPSLGIKILAPESYANLSAIDHARYVFPDSAMTDGMKFRFLDGTVVQRTSDRPYDWSVVASVGPFNLEIEGNQRFAVAFVGGTSVAQLQANADLAQTWYNTNTGLEQTPGTPAAAHRFDVTPNPLRNRATVSYFSAREGLLELRVYDAGGRLVEAKAANVKAGAGSLVWEPGNLARGVYFLDLCTPDDHGRMKALLLE